MTIRLHSAWSDSGRGRHLRLRSLTRAVSYLVSDEAEHRLWPANIGTGRVAVIRDAGHDSRQIRDAVRAGATGQWSLLDLAAVPEFGRIPVAGDIRLVVAGDASLMAAARRCAAFWRCGVLAPATVATVATWENLVLRPTPAVAISTSHDWYDHTAERWALHGELAIRHDTGQQERVEDLVVHPHEHGILVTRHRRDPHLVRTSMTIRIEQAATGTIDGHPQTFPAGEYTCAPQQDRFHQVLGPGTQP
ncbi:hypothetical protein [Prauserella flavalba]|uniref:Uncharacterized protein n=1 Tax=Prauserella flavalba TaxID=1477506 RepID=A0A318L924_9PSEU|nr:hypothetical protein [Prauserella flavalba]PXY17042.1 hypothetical protein BA062_37855 [Prauserella flavalba]